MVFVIGKINLNLRFMAQRFFKISSLSKWGNQSVTYGKRVYPSGTPKMKTWKFKKDNSWKK